MHKFFAVQSDLRPRQLVENLLAEVRRFEAGGPQADDITALVLTYLGPTGPVILEVANRMPELERLGQAVEGFAASFHIGPRISNALQLAIEELFTNAVSYGYPDGAGGTILLSMDTREGWVEVELRDDGRPFDPLSEGPPVNTQASLEERGIGGLGIHLTRKLFDEVTYERREEQNVVRLRKRLEES